MKNSSTFVKCARRTNGLCHIESCSGLIKLNLEAPFVTQDFETKFLGVCYLIDPPYTQEVPLEDVTESSPGRKPTFRHGDGVKKNSKGGRPKSQDKEDQVTAALIWLKKHPGQTPPQAADYIYGVDEVRNKHPNGYKRPPAGTKSRDDSFVKAIYRALEKQSNPK